MTYIRVLLSVLCVALLTSVGRGSGGGLTNIGCLSTGATGATGARQWVSLGRTGQFLVGEVGEGAVESLVIYAPGVETGNVILREIVFPDGGRSIFVSAPADLQAAVQRVSVYVRGNPRTAVLLEYRDGEWKKHLPRLVHFQPDENASGDGILLEFCVAGLGQFHLLDASGSSDSGQAPILPTVTAHGLVGGGVSDGFWHLGWAVLLLTLASIASRWAHTIQSRRL